MATVEHVSIGDVLDQLRPEFEDITISKIRFLESQGLIDPERTPSGYRKFHEPDLQRLRWVLLQQKEHFLPLKVIKERLERDGIPTNATERDGGGRQRSSGGRSARSRELTRSELARVAGLTEHQIDELESYGLLRAISGTADGASYGAEAEVVAKLASGFIRHGVQARHLRVYLHTAEREAGLYAQLLL